MPIEHSNYWALVTGTSPNYSVTESNESSEYPDGCSFNAFPLDNDECLGFGDATTARDFDLAAAAPPLGLRLGLTAPDIVKSLSPSTTAATGPDDDVAPPPVPVPALDPRFLGEANFLATAAAETTCFSGDVRGTTPFSAAVETMKAAADWRLVPSASFVEAAPAVLETVPVADVVFLAGAATEPAVPGAGPLLL